MKTNFLIGIFVFVIVGIGSLLARIFSLYDAYWFTDIILHTLSGVGFGFIWIALQKERSSWLLLLLGCMSAAVFGSVLWEFGEYSVWKLWPPYGPFYSPRLPDAFGDILCGLIGGIFAFLFQQKR
jgi:hypothetical protein